jgi:hypothetical protein
MTESEPAKGRNYKAPGGLGSAGTELWTGVAERYDLRPDEVRILGDAAREADIIERLESESWDQPLMVKGSMGQLTASPLITELRMHRSTLSQLLYRLKLPDSPSQGERKKARVSEDARMAARARWGSGAGTG